MASSCLRVSWALDAEEPACGNRCRNISRSRSSRYQHFSWLSAGAETTSISFPARCHATFGGLNTFIVLQQRIPVKNCGNFTGKMTASLSESFAPSSPATSSHCRDNHWLRQAVPGLAQLLNKHLSCTLMKLEA